MVAFDPLFFRSTIFKLFKTNNADIVFCVNILIILSLNAQFVLTFHRPLVASSFFFLLFLCFFSRISFTEEACKIMQSYIVIEIGCDYVIFFVFYLTKQNKFLSSFFMLLCCRDVILFFRPLMLRISDKSLIKFSTLV